MKQKAAGPARLYAALILAVGLVLGGFAWPGATGAAVYTVSECGWHVGHDAEWAETPGSNFARSSFCQAPPGPGVFDGVHMTSETRGGNGSVAGTRFARWRWSAPAGTTITNVHGHYWQVVSDGFEHRLGGINPSGFTPFLKLDTIERGRPDFKALLPAGTTAFESRLLCARSEAKRCSIAKSSLAGVRALTFTLVDASPPSAAIGGDLAALGWVRGSRALDWSARDRGSGLRFSETSIDGSVRVRTTHPCSSLTLGGLIHASRMLPCGLAVSGRHTLDTAGLSDGPHQLRFCALDFAGTPGCALTTTIRTDNTPPAAPRDLAVAGGDDWRRVNRFDLGWTIPDQGPAAPVTGSRFRLTGPDGLESEVRPGTGPDGVTGLAVPGPGEYRVRVWLVDAAGNERPEATAGATLRFDDLPPSGHFLETPGGHPELLRVSVDDRHSGVAGGRISIRPVSGGTWRDLPTELTGGDGERRLTAAVPSDELAPGLWQARAEVRDLAGNETVTSTHGNGTAVRFRTPLKADSAITARLVGPRRSGSVIRVGYRQRAQVAGRLAAGRLGLGGQQLRVTELPRAGSRRRPLVRLVRTRADGQFRLALRRGASRRISLSFAGSERYSPASAGPFELRVRGGLGFRVGPRSLSTGQRIRIRGRIGTAFARGRAAGNLIAVQYLERASGRWRPVLVTRTGRGGRFRASYRFRYITGKARIRLRAVLIPAPGFPYAKSVSGIRVVRVRG